MNKSNCFSGFDELAGVAAAGLLPEALLLTAAFEPEPEALDFELLFVTLEPVLLDALLVSALFGSETELSAVPLPETLSLKSPFLKSTENNTAPIITVIPITVTNSQVLFFFFSAGTLSCGLFTMSSVLSSLFKISSDVTLNIFDKAIILSMVGWV